MSPKRQLAYKEAHKTKKVNELREAVTIKLEG